MASGTIAKMHTQFTKPVAYALPIGEAQLPMNGFLGKKLFIRFEGAIHCIHCGAATRTSFSQGYCFRCMQTLAACDLCILKPETCHFHLGTCREPEWGESHCMIDHTVYLANSSGLKVGITRSHQVRTRWMDQGATQALPIAKVRNRRASGLLETALAKLVPDKTNWRLMLQGRSERIDLKKQRDELLRHFPPDVEADLLPEADEIEIEYPVLEYPKKVASFNLDKNPRAEGTLMGIKGQYLILDTGVLNTRKYTGYRLTVTGE